MNVQNVMVRGVIGFHIKWEMMRKMECGGLTEMPLHKCKATVLTRGSMSSVDVCGVQPQEALMGDHIPQVPPSSMGEEGCFTVARLVRFSEIQIITFGSFMHTFIMLSSVSTLSSWT